MVDPAQPGERAWFERELAALLRRHGAPEGDALARDVQVAVDAMLEALVATDRDGSSLSPLDVVRIRSNKLAAVVLPVAVFRAPQRLAALRAEVHALASRWLGEQGGHGRFGGPKPA